MSEQSTTYPQRKPCPECGGSGVVEVRDEELVIWKSIETAPKDRWILLGFYTPVHGMKDAYESGPMVVVWDGECWTDGGGYYSNSGRLTPTHWAEIPKFDGRIVGPLTSDG